MTKKSNKENRLNKSAQWKISLQVDVDGKTEIVHPIGVEVLRQIVSASNDMKASVKLFQILSDHPSSCVRQEIAYKDCINEKTVRNLEKDLDISVLRNLCNNSQFKKLGSESTFRRLINFDRDCAETIAINLDEYHNVDLDTLMDDFLSSADPQVRLFLANRFNTPKKVLKTLCTDPDPGVAEMAERRLSEH